MDDIAEYLHEEAHKQMDRQASAGGWPTDVERLVYQNLDTALVLYLTHLDQIDGTHDRRTACPPVP